MRRFFIILGSIIGANLVCWFTLNSILVRLAAPEACRWILAGFIILQIAGTAAVIGARALGYQPGTGMGRPFLSLLLIWNMLLALPTAGISMIWLLVWKISLQPDAVSGLDPQSQTIGFIAVAAPFAIALLATVVAVWQLNRFRIQRLRLKIPHLPPALEGFTIVHLSDLHIGKLTRGKVLDDMVAATNQFDADLILLTGDLINFALEDLPRGIELLRQMKSRHGLFLCEGNHDLIESRSRFESAAKASGLQFLLHETAMFSVKGQPVQVLGLRWGEGMPHAQDTGSASPDTLDQLLARGNPGAFNILLAHHPEAFDEAVAAGIPLTLAGHTHGGQLMFTPSFGFGPWLYRYWSGLYRKDESQLVVSNGTGNWFPLRIGAPAEIIHLTLVSDS